MKNFKELMGQLDEGVSPRALASYLETALWSSTDGGDGNLDDNYGPRDVDKGTLNTAKRDLQKFFNQAKKYIKGLDEKKVAHDFWLTRNGHGAGFWDGDYEFGDELTKIAEKFKQVELYVGDDGKIYS